MSNKQYHYVVRWDTKDGTWSVDPITLDAKFDGVTIWDEDKSEWLDYRDGDALQEEVVGLEDKLADLLRASNERNGVQNG